MAKMKNMTPAAGRKATAPKAKPQIEVVDVGEVKLPPLLERLVSGAEVAGPPPEESCPPGWKRVELLPNGGVTRALSGVGVGGKDVRWGDETGRVHPVPPQVAPHLLRQKFHNQDPETGAMNSGPLFQIVE